VNGFELSVGLRDQGKLVPQSLPAPVPSDGRVIAAGGIVRRFVDAIVAGTDMSPGLAEGVRVQQILEAMRMSDQTGQWQDV
jgi:hypothetical protein